MWCRPWVRVGFCLRPERGAEGGGREGRIKFGDAKKAGGVPALVVRMVRLAGDFATGYCEKREG